MRHKNVGQGSVTLDRSFRVQITGPRVQMAITGHRVQMAITGHRVQTLVYRLLNIVTHRWVMAVAVAVAVGEGVGNVGVGEIAIVITMNNSY
jgi:hypothetical protein